MQLYIEKHIISPKNYTAILQSTNCQQLSLSSTVLQCGKKVWESASQRLCLIDFYRCPKSNQHCKYLGFIKAKGLLLYLQPSGRLSQLLLETTEFMSVTSSEWTHFWRSHNAVLPTLARICISLTAPNSCCCLKTPLFLPKRASSPCGLSRKD